MSEAEKPLRWGLIGDGGAKANFSALRQKRICGSIDHVFDSSFNIVLIAPCFVRKGADLNET
jgi:hypothetical protein